MIRKIISALTGSGRFADRVKDEAGAAERQQLMLSLVLGPLLAQALLIYLFATAPSLRSGVVVLALALAAFWLLLPMLTDCNAVSRVKFLAVTNAEFAALYGAFLFGGARSIFLPWVVGAVVAGMLLLRDWKRAAISTGVALFAFFAAQSLVPITSGHLSSGLVTNASTLCILLVIAYLSMTMYARRILADRQADGADGPLTELSQSAEAAEAVDRDISCFFAEASHAIRAPLDGIIGYSEILTEEGTSMFDAQQLDDLRRIHQAAQQLLSLVSGVFDLSEIEAGQTAFSDRGGQLSDAATVR